MKKGFTILELLIASLLLGMLMTILTMIFNQSSIAWRTGIAGVAELQEVRSSISAVREESDEMYIWGSDMNRIISPWDSSGSLRTRAVSAGNYTGERVAYLTGLNSSSKLQDQRTVSVNSGNGNGSMNTYTINVKSAGPDREFDTWDDIWSFPDDFE